MIDMTAKSNILEFNDRLSEALATRVHRQKLNFLHNWAEGAEDTIEPALRRVSQDFFSEMSRSDKGIGRTSRMTKMPGLSRSHVAGLPWKALSGEWMRRKEKSRYPDSADQFFVHTGKLKREIGGMTWAKVFGAPEVYMDRRTERRITTELREGFTQVGVYSGGKPKVKGANNRYAKVGDAFREVISHTEWVDMEIDYTPLLNEVTLGTNVFEEAMSSHVSDSDKFLYKLGGPAGKVRPLVTPFAAWYLDVKMPAVLGDALRKVRSRHGLL